jgi:hypothetical protein
VANPARRTVLAFRPRGQPGGARLTIVASEVVPDVLSGLVAAGTLALAGATVYLGRGAAHAAINAASPRVVVTWLLADDAARARPTAAGTDAGAIRPGTPWPMSQHGATLVGIRAVGQVRNESAVTALVRLECGPDTEAGPVTFRDPDPLGGPPVNVALTRQGEWHVLSPGATADFSILWWQPASTWAEAWRRHVQDPQTPPPVTTTRLIVRGASGDAQDQCDLIFGGYLMVPHPREDTWVIAIVDPADRGMRGYAPPRLATIGLMQRSYRQPAWLDRARPLRTPSRSALRLPRRRPALPGDQSPDSGSSWQEVAPPNSQSAGTPGAGTPRTAPHRIPRPPATY